ncbi:nicotinate-nucleotide--dimethylbenzimidazole phosphoribosyltransferase [Anaeroselena agilis]|uniref:Nicotinate-nucleotide--dimethylbenzimidazole phosphoribosyltransferase n=1 Tax=Anaeroselena agilis TaxID=3063788 RepID=A0ABU3NUF8_9FIRM|nr:nicotinate-nucleotide--dimethylbenzimidazole phosphoribosyltransferase [Selenomonadales bacterium 4137-cl]
MLKDTIAAIGPLDETAMADCQLRIDNLTKPLGSLHGLERLAVLMAGITGRARPRDLVKHIILMAADHGVAAEGVSAYPREVTPQMVMNFCNGGAAINAFARHAGAQLILVDIGVAVELPPMPGLYREKVAPGTANIALGPAMTREQALRAIDVGIRMARVAVSKGAGVIGLGEMGIGNTTPSTAIIASYSERQHTELTGRGTGLSAAAIAHKADIIARALAVNRPDPADPLDVLAKVGGFEIAGLVGVILGAAAGRAAVVIDGIITSAAALLAVKLAPAAGRYLVGSHFSCEPAHREALKLIGLDAYLHLNMRLGEGTGAALGMRLIDAGLHVLNDMKTFGEAAVAVAQDGPGALRQSADIV